jgi:glycerophosphoryl diester phosphodiesterase
LQVCARQRLLIAGSVEFDVRLTADGAPVLLHDDRLDRTTNGRGKVSALPLATVRRYDAGSWFGAAFALERIPTLEEAVALASDLSLGANIELKAKRGTETATGMVVADLLARTGPSQTSRLVISSFRPDALAAAGARAPQIPRSILFQSIPRNWRHIAERFGCTAVHADHEQLCPPVVSEICRAGYPLLAYTVNNPERAKTLFDWGVTSVFSDIPQRLHDIGARAGCSQPVIAEPFSAGTPR